MPDLTLSLGAGAQAEATPTAVSHFESIGILHIIIGYEDGTLKLCARKKAGASVSLSPDQSNLAGISQRRISSSSTRPNGTSSRHERVVSLSHLGHTTRPQITTTTAAVSYLPTRDLESGSWGDISRHQQENPRSPSPTHSIASGRSDRSPIGSPGAQSPGAQNAFAGRIASTSSIPGSLATAHDALSKIVQTQGSGADHALAIPQDTARHASKTSLEPGSVSLDSLVPIQISPPLPQAYPSKKDPPRSIEGARADLSIKAHFFPIVSIVGTNGDADKDGPHFMALDSSGKISRWNRLGQPLSARQLEWDEQSPTSRLCAGRHDVLVSVPRGPQTILSMSSFETRRSIEEELWIVAVAALNDDVFLALGEHGKVTSLSADSSSNCGYLSDDNTVFDGLDLIQKNPEPDSWHFLARSEDEWYTFTLDKGSINHLCRLPSSYRTTAISSNGKTIVAHDTEEGEVISLVPKTIDYDGNISSLRPNTMISLEIHNRTIVADLCAIHAGPAICAVNKDGDILTFTDELAIQDKFVRDIKAAGIIMPWSDDSVMKIKGTQIKLCNFAESLTSVDIDKEIEPLGAHLEDLGSITCMAQPEQDVIIGTDRGLVAVLTGLGSVPERSSAVRSLGILPNAIIGIVFLPTTAAESLGWKSGSLALDRQGYIAIFDDDSMEGPIVIPPPGACISTIACRDTELSITYVDGSTSLCAMARGKFQAGASPQEALRSVEPWSKLYDISPTFVLRQWSDVIGASTRGVNIDMSNLIARLGRVSTVGSSNALFSERGLSNTSKDTSEVFGSALATGYDGVASGSSQPTVNLTKAHGLQKTLLGLLWPWDISARMDGILKQSNIEQLQIDAQLSVEADGTVFSVHCQRQHELYCSTPLLTAHSLLVVTSMTKALHSLSSKEDSASQLLAFLIADLGTGILSGFQNPDLGYLARFYMHSPGDITDSARLLLTTWIGRTTATGLRALLDQNIGDLTNSLDAGVEMNDRQRSNFLLLTLIAGEKPGVPSVEEWKILARALQLSLDQEQDDLLRRMSIECLSKHFSTWQYHCDSIRILRAMVAIATSKVSIAASTPLITLARSAILLIVGANSRLFLAVLSTDILGSQDAAQRIAAMKLMSMIIRRKASILSTMLPRLVQEIARSLDPTTAAVRDAVLPTATMVLHDLVRTYPTLDFHNKTQRLACGTHEGAVICYDLKSGTRLYVLEGHHHPLSLVSYSPDGKRLVTVSVEENVCNAWKTSHGFLSMITPGAPWQGGFGGGGGGLHRSTAPFKTFPFQLGNMNEDIKRRASLRVDWIRANWSDRTVRITIWETVLSFAV